MFKVQAQGTTGYMKYRKGLLSTYPLEDKITDIRVTGNGDNLISFHRTPFVIIRC